MTRLAQYKASSSHRPRRTSAMIAGGIARRAASATVCARAVEKGSGGPNSDQQVLDCCDDGQF